MEMLLYCDQNQQMTRMLLNGTVDMLSENPVLHDLDLSYFHSLIDGSYSNRPKYPGSRLYGMTHRILFYAHRSMEMLLYCDQNQQMTRMLLSDTASS
jgi:hypothetical protein